MSNALAIFISGITGVLAGMSLLYLSLKITFLIVDRMGAFASHRLWYYPCQPSPGRTYGAGKGSFMEIL